MQFGLFFLKWFLIGVVPRGGPMLHLFLLGGGGGGVSMRVQKY